MQKIKIVSDPSKTTKRISKACDSCRVRKTKCNGKHPCQQCSDNDRNCTFDDKVSRRKPHSAVYVAELERENEHLQRLLLTSGSEKRLSSAPRLSPETISGTSDNDFDSSRPPPLDTMIATTAQLFLDARGKYRYQGHSAGFTLLGYVQDGINHMLRDSSGNEGWVPFDIWKAFDRPSPLTRPLHPPERFDILPSKEVAQMLTDIALDDGCSLMSFVHRPTFSRFLDQIYANPDGPHSSEDDEFLPVLYEALALGSLFTVEQETDQAGKLAAERRSLVYFHAGRDLIDMMVCSDIFTLQAIMFMVMFLQSSGRLSACHSYLSVAIASAMRLGIHSSTPLGQDDIVRDETRKRIIWELYTMETYVTAMLGLPKLLNQEYIRQTLPSEVEVYGDLRARSPTEANVALVASNDHTELLLILSKIISEIYPVSTSKRGIGGRYQVDYEKIAEIERLLYDWHTKLPTTLPSHTEYDGPQRTNQIRTQLRLRLAYAHVEMVLYRPFLHHFIRKGSDASPDMRSYACSSACIKAAMQVIWLVDHLARQNLLTGTYWLTVYMTFFASMALLLFSLGNDRDPTASDALKAAEKGRQILTALSESCPTAAEAAESLTFLSTKVARASGVHLSDE